MNYPNVIATDTIIVWPAETGTPGDGSVVPVNEKVTGADVGQADGATLSGLLLGPTLPQALTNVAT
jgi:hypothetical protein